MSLKFSKIYFLLFLIVLDIEICIAIFVKTGFIRSVFGDFLAVILLYFFIQSFIRTKYSNSAVIALLSSYSIEFLQLTNLLEMTAMQNNIIVKTILGNTFSWEDIIAYTLGICFILLVEKLILSS